MLKKTITERDVNRLVKLVMEATFTDPASKTLLDRPYTINGDGTVSIKNDEGKYRKVRFGIIGVDANIVTIKPLSNGGYRVITKKGIEQDVSKKQTQTIIKFVDTGKPAEVDSGDWATPNLRMRYA